MILKFILALSAVTAPMIATPTAFAQKTIEEREEDYQTCVRLLTPRAGQQYAEGYCYDRHYGGDQTGGGDPDSYDRPKPGNDCYGQQRPCTKPE